MAGHLTVCYCAPVAQSGMGMKDKAVGVDSARPSPPPSLQVDALFLFPFYSAVKPSELFVFVVVSSSCKVSIWFFLVSSFYLL